MDLYACIDSPVVAEPFQTVVIPTGIAIALPDPSHAAFVYARSGLAIKHGLAPSNCVGVIDSDYRGEILVGLTNHSVTAYEIVPGERIAQMIIAPVCLPEIIEAGELDETGRGAGGFGSTGRA
jgi:dUTP pyrophosphatase